MASKNIVLKEATYNGVESIELPQSGGGNALFTEVSDTTATASDVASGKYFYTSAGVKTEGTASGGGGGLEYEEGTWTPSEDIADTTISFSNSHTTPPIMVMITETSSQSIGVANSNALLAIINPYTYLGYPIVNGEIYRYGMGAFSYATSSGLSSSTSNMTSLGALETYLSTTYFRAYAGSTTRYWRAGRTYKWIAVWAPTT